MHTALLNINQEAFSEKKKHRTTTREQENELNVAHSQRARSLLQAQKERGCCFAQRHMKIIKYEFLLSISRNVRTETTGYQSSQWKKETMCDEMPVAMYVARHSLSHRLLRSSKIDIILGAERLPFYPFTAC